MLIFAPRHVGSTRQIFIFGGVRSNGTENTPKRDRVSSGVGVLATHARRTVLGATMPRTESVLPVQMGTPTNMHLCMLRSER
jgi:hypothetical protein